MKLKERIYLLNILTNSKKDLICVVPNHNLTKNLNKTELSNYYENHEILNNIPKNTKILNFNLDNLTIDETKILIAKETGENVFDLYLFGSELAASSSKRKQLQLRSSMFNEPIFKNDIQLGFEYRSEYGVRSLPNDYTKFVDRKIKINNLDERVDLGTDLIRNYNIKNNEINVVSRKSLKNLETTKYKDNILDLETVYFGQNNPYKDFEEYKLFISEKYDLVVSKSKLLQSQLEVLHKLDKSLLPKIIDESSIKFNNLVYECNIGDNKEINLEYLFKNFKFAENTDVLFLHYYDTIKNNYYRINEAKLFPNITKVKPDSINKVNMLLKSLRKSISERHKQIGDIKDKYNSNAPIQADDIAEINKIEQEKVALYTEIESVTLQKQKLETRVGFDFNNSENYLVDFVKGKYDVSINKKTIQGWKKNIYLASEQDIKLKLKGIECLSIKLNFEKSIITLVITRLGECFIKTTDLVNNYFLQSSKINEMIKTVNKCITIFNLMLKDYDKISVINNQAPLLEIQHVAVPTSALKLRSFLGLANVLKSSIPNFALIVKPLTKLCNKNVPSSLSSSFIDLKMIV